MITKSDWPGLHNPTAEGKIQRLDDAEQRFEVIITPFGERLRLGARIDYYERKVLFGGKVVYCDTLDWQKALTQRDPLSEFHNWLNNTGRYSRKETNQEEDHDHKQCPLPAGIDEATLAKARRNWPDLCRQVEEYGKKRQYSSNSTKCSNDSENTSEKSDGCLTAKTSVRNE